MSLSVQSAGYWPGKHSPQPRVEKVPGAAKTECGGSSGEAPAGDGGKGEVATTTTVSTVYPARIIITTLIVVFIEIVFQPQQ